jgi:glutaconate CoA-transferase subunit A
MVDLVVEEPRGAWPTGCAGLYAADEAHLDAYLTAAEAGREREYLETVVQPVRRHAEAARESAATEAA